VSLFFQYASLSLSHPRPLPFEHTAIEAKDIAAVADLEAKDRW